MRTARAQHDRLDAMLPAKPVARRHWSNSWLTVVVSEHSTRGLSVRPKHRKLDALTQRKSRFFVLEKHKRLASGVNRESDSSSRVDLVKTPVAPRLKVTRVKVPKANAHRKLVPKRRIDHRRKTRSCRRVFEETGGARARACVRSEVVVSNPYTAPTIAPRQVHQCMHRLPNQMR